MKSLVITLVGKDKPGLIDSIAQTVSNAEGNWLASSFSHMAGQFAGFAEINLPEEKQAQLIDALNTHPDLQITLSEGQSASAKQLRQANLEVHGNDRPGIVQELTGVLNQFNLNIVQFESTCESAPNWGNIIFKANTIVELPQDVDTDELQETLEALSDDLVVEIQL